MARRALWHCANGFLGWPIFVGSVATLGMGLASSVSAAPAAYSSAVLSLSPYVYYRFNDSSGPTLTDSSGNTRNGTYSAGAQAPTFNQTGAGTGSDNAVAFNGTNEYATVPSSAIGGFGPSLATSSYEFVFKTNAGFSTSLTTAPAVFSITNTGFASDHTAVSLALDQNAAAGASSTYANLFIRSSNGDSTRVAFPQTAFVDGNYHDLIITYDGAKNATVYVDGTAIPSASLVYSGSGIQPGDTSANFAYAMTIASGQSQGTPNGNYAGLTIDEAALYPTVLNQSEVTADFNASGTPEPTSAAIVCVTAACLSLRRRRSPNRRSDQPRV